MKKNSREVDEYIKSDAFRRKEKRMKEILNIEKRDKKITASERDRILNKVRDILETGKGEYLTKEEEEILKEIAGVYFSVYKKTIETLNNSEIGDEKDER